MKKIVITGGPGGGKTTALDLFRREIEGKVAVIPESATAVFSGGVQRDTRAEVVKAIQKMIYYHQKNIEHIYQCQNHHQLFLCDRGTLDGLAYWPDSEESFLKQMKTTLEHELAKYDAVIFFETAAICGGEITSNNPFRTESNEKAIELDKKLKSIWSRHPNFHVVKSKGSFVEKIMDGIQIIKQVVQ